MLPTMSNSRRCEYITVALDYIPGLSLFLYRLLDEVARLERNIERTHAREKAKGLGDSSVAISGIAGSSVGGKPSGTQRRCANCGQVGHIKTNKKYVELASLTNDLFHIVISSVR